MPCLTWLVEKTGEGEEEEEEEEEGGWNRRSVWGVAVEGRWEGRGGGRSWWEGEWWREGVVVVCVKREEVAVAVVFGKEEGVEEVAWKQEEVLRVGKV